MGSAFRRCRILPLLGTPLLGSRRYLAAKHPITAVVLFLLAAAAVVAQPDEVFPEATPDSTKARYGTGGGISIRLNESGFGLGGLYRARLGSSTSGIVELSVGVAKDAREQQFFIGLFGDTVTPFKRNYMVLAPIQAGVEQRIFAGQLEDNFRPYVQVSAGPTLGYQWPYFRDVNGNGLREEGEALNGLFGGIGEGQFKLGAGGTLAIGAYFGKSRRSTQGVRLGYVASYFFEDVELLEPAASVESPARRFFGGPVVSFHLVRLLD